MMSMRVMARSCQSSILMMTRGAGNADNHVSEQVHYQRCSFTPLVVELAQNRPLATS